MIAIENKPYAGDQDNQVADYLKQLDRLARPLSGLIYLSRDGSPPSDASIGEAQREAKASQLHPRSYPDLVPWLEACRGACEADRVAVFLDEIRAWIRHTFEGVTDQMEREQVIRTALASPQAVESAMLVAAAARDIRLKLLETLPGAVQGRLADPRWTVTSTLDQAYYPRLEVDFDPDLSVIFAMEFNSARGVLSRLDWGVCLRQESVKRGKPFGAAMTEAFGRASSTALWPWFRTCSPAHDEMTFEEDWETSAQIWAEVARDEVAPRIATAARATFEALATAKLARRPPGRRPVRKD